jgi:hypothetical protein
MPVLRTDVAGSEQTDDGSDQTDDGSDQTDDGSDQTDDGSDQTDDGSKVEHPASKVPASKDARAARERAIEAITDQARVARARAPHSRAMWIAAGSVLVISVIACVMILVADGEPTAKPQSTEGRLGFSPGIVIGIAIGILIGFAIAKQRNRD